MCLILLPCAREAILFTYDGIVDSPWYRPSGDINPRNSLPKAYTTDNTQDSMTYSVISGLPLRTAEKKDRHRISTDACLRG